ncbi:pentapeptide repeat-containing protein [Kitasatospora aburaviensis]
MWGILAALGAIGAVGVALWRVPWWLDENYLPTITLAQATAITGVRTALLAIGAGGLVAVGILYTHRTLHQGREGQVTDRYTKAIGQIASDKPVEQLGGIYALERIMRDSAKDHATIVEVLAAFVRQHAPAPPRHRPGILRRRPRPTPAPTTLVGLVRAHQELRRWRLSNPDGGAHTVRLRPVEPVQAALTVLGRRPRDRMEPFVLDLADTDLRGANLHNVYLERANLAGANLEGAVLFEAHLERANLAGANLERAILGLAHLERANLAGTNLERAILGLAHLERANLAGTHMGLAILAGAHLERAHLRGAHLEGADLAGAHLEGADLAGAYLERAILRGAHLEGADLAGAYLKQAHLGRANLQVVEALTVEQVVSARPRESTTLPAELAADGRVRARIAAVQKEGW